MGIRSWLGLTESTVVTEALTRAAAAENHAELLGESIADLQMAMDDRGWQKLSAWGDQEFTRDGIATNARLCRVMAVANPLIKRGLGIRRSYIWGGGVQISARSAGDDTEQDVNAVIQRFLDDPGNKAAVTGDQARETLETALGTDGNVAIALFTSPRTGFVQVRTIPFDEITDVLNNPEDRSDPWYYLRTWQEQSIGLDGRTGTVERKAWYPALGRSTRTRHKVIDGVEVRLDTPVRLVKVNALDGWDWGVGDAFAAIPWARSYRDFLADWANLVKALSQFAWKLQAGNASKADALRAKVARAGVPTPGNEGTAGGTAVMTGDVSMEAIPKTGATIDSQSGKPLAAMAASAMGVPVTMLLGDPGITGARATAETLDKPTENEMNSRRRLWGEVYKDILFYVIMESVKAPLGQLTGSVIRDPFTGRETLVMSDDTDLTIDVDWPPLEDTDVKTVVDAVVAADGTGKLPPLTVVKLLLQALGVEDVDEIIDEVTDDDGNWIDPYETVGAAVAAAATNAFRRGQDPAATLNGEE